MRERAALDAVHGTSHAMLAVLQEERKVRVVLLLVAWRVHRSVREAVRAQHLTLPSAPSPTTRCHLAV